jgi:predicted DNA-binding transcriptional regulator AlpA
MTPKIRSERQSQVDRKVEGLSDLNTMTNDELWTKEEVAAFLKLSNPRSVLKLPIDRVRLGARTIRWRRSVVQSYADQRTEKAA